MNTNGNRIAGQIAAQKSAPKSAPSLPEIRNSGERLFQNVHAFVLERPVTCVVGAFAAGVVIAWFIKRNR